MAALLRRWRPRRALDSSSSSVALSSIPSTRVALTASSAATAEEEEASASQYGRLRRRILRLRFPRRSAAAAIDDHVCGGAKIAASELRRIVAELRKAGRYKHALEILAWMDSNTYFHLSSSDHAARLDLIARVHGIVKAEEYFTKLTTPAKKAASFPLLHYYVKARDVDKAEILMAHLQNCGLIVDPHPFNEMMKLYMAMFQYEKVLTVVRHMKRNKIPLDVLSYNLWMSAFSEVYTATTVEAVLDEMMNDKNIEAGWSTYATLANIYIKNGLYSKAFSALGTAEQKLSKRKRLGYSFIMTLYAALNDKDGVLRLWELSKTVPGRITCTNYMSAMLCLIKVGDIGRAEWIFQAWESGCRKYDVRVSNVLLGAYMRNGWIDKAEKLHLRTLERGAHPNYKTWEILMEGWVKSGQMDKAVKAMKKGFSLLRSCHWRPPAAIVEAIAEYFEEKRDAEDAKRYLKVLSSLEITSLPVYKSILRACLGSKTMHLNVLEMMARDHIEPDEEMEELVLCAGEINMLGAG